jgi:hypothetical protein
MLQCIHSENSTVAVVRPIKISAKSLVVSQFLLMNYCTNRLNIGHILFLRILYHIPYHGPKKDIISYHISRPKKGYRIYILYTFQFENEPNMAWIGIKHRKVVISMFILEICNCLQMPVQCSVCVQCSVLSKRELPTTSVNKNYIVQKKKTRQSSNLYWKRI